MEVTLEILENLRACSEGIEWYKIQKETDLMKLLKKSNRKSISFFNWFVSRSLNKDNRVKYAIFAAGKVLHIFEEKYPEDKRPRLAIRASENYLKNKDAAGAASASAAAVTAYAACAAVTASAAASASAASAAYAASVTVTAAAAAYAADAAACAAAAYAAYATDDDNLYLKTLKTIVKYGIKLLEENQK